MAKQPTETEGRFPALSSPAFRLLWIGLSLSAIGTKMQDMTLRWHLYGLTHSLVALGLIGLCRFVPLVLFSMLGGALADAKDRRRIMLLTQSALALGAATLACLTQRGAISAASIYVVSGLSAAALAFDSPARQSLMPSLLPRKHFGNAASLISTASKTATVVGPCIAGYFLQSSSIALIYWINATSFLAVLIAVLSIRPETTMQEKREPNKVDLASLREGLRFVWSKPILLWPMCLDFLACFFASAEALLMVIAGGSATLLGPIVGAGLVVLIKNVASGYIERWNFVLGAIFVAIVVFMPEGLVPGVARLARRVRGR